MQYDLELLQEDVGCADRLGLLREIRERASAELSLCAEGTDLVEWYRRVNNMHDLLIQRTVRLAERDLQNRGLGTPPVPYSVVLLGSGGRFEQNLWSDQDNGLVYMDPDENGRSATDGYFAELGKRIVHGLQKIGYPPCDGNVVCSSPLWCQPLSEWVRRAQNWLRASDWESIRYALILSDMRTIYGNDSFALKIKQGLRQTVSADRSIIKHFLENTLHRKVALGVFGQLITERYGEAAGGFDIKYGSYIPLVNAIRLLAICLGLLETPSLLRLETMANSPAIPSELVGDWRDSFLVALKLRARATCRHVDGLMACNPILPQALLDTATKRELKWSLHTEERLQKFIRHLVEK